MSEIGDVMTGGVIPFRPQDEIHPIDCVLRDEAIAALKERRRPRDEEELLKGFPPGQVSRWRERNESLQAARLERLEREKAKRGQLRIEARKRQARIPNRFLGMDFDDLDTTYNPDAIAACRAVGNPRVRSSPPGLMLLGKPGNGKTTMAAAALEEFIVATNGLWPARFWGVPLELQTQRDQMQDDDKDRISELADCKLVVIDDIDKVVREGDRRSPWVDEMIFTVIDSLYARKARVIITSNWTALEVWDRLDYAVMSRITEMCRVIELNTHDYRILP